MKSRINPETGELVWEGETKAERAQAEAANKVAETAPLEALAEAFGETKTETIETVTLPGIDYGGITVIETENTIVIESNDIDAPEPFIARLETSSLVTTREATLKAFAAVLQILDNFPYENDSGKPIEPGAGGIG